MLSVLSKVKTDVQKFKSDGSGSVSPFETCSRLPQVVAKASRNTNVGAHDKDHCECY